MKQKTLIAAARSESLTLLKALSFAVLFALSVGLLTSCSESTSKTKPDSSEVSKEGTEKEFTPDQSVTSNTVSNFDLSAYEGPTFTLATPDGSTMTFTDMLGKGKPLVVNFWGTWCGPCRREMPEFVKIYDEYKSKGLQLVGIALRDTPEKVKAYTSQAGIKWPMVLGNVETAKAFGGITGIPTTIFYDSQGLELSRYVGPMSFKMFKERLDSALLHESELASL